MRKEAFKHDYSGSCSPQNGAIGNTFSVGCFQWLPKSNGSGLKKSAVKFRVKGFVSDPDKVYKNAEQVCDKLDAGWIPDTKNMTVKT